MLRAASCRGWGQCGVGPDSLLGLAIGPGVGQLSEEMGQWKHGKVLNGTSRVSVGLEVDSAWKKWCLTYGFVYLIPCPQSSKSFQVGLRALRTQELVHW